MELSQEYIDRLLKKGNWMIRFDDDGTSYDGFKWKSKGEWTECPNWHEKPVCEGGLFGQSPLAAGFCKSGSRMVLCETGKQIIVDERKVKTNRAMIIEENESIPHFFISALVGGSLDLRGYNHPLPEGLTQVGGYLHLSGYNHPLPEGLTQVGGYLYLRGYNHPLPEGLTQVGGSLYLSGYNHPLPKGLTQVGGYLYLSGYNYPLPEGLTQVGGSLHLRGYNHPLPEGLTQVGTYLYLRGYNHPLPEGLK